MKLSLTPLPPYDFDRSLSVFTRWGDESLLDYYREGLYRRVVPTSGGNVLLEFRSLGTVDEPAVAVSSLSPTNDATAAELRAMAEHVLNAEFDLAPSIALMIADPVLADHVEAFRGVRPPLLPSLFEALVVAIIEQQIALPVAIRLKARLVREYGEVFTYEQNTYYAFPSSAVLRAVAPADIRALGLSLRKAEYVTGLADQVAEGGIDLAAVAGLADDELVARLTSIRGVGRWTAEYAALRGLGRMSFLLADGLGIRNTVAQLYFGGRKPQPDEIRALLDDWGEQKGLLAFYLLNLARLSRGPVSDAAEGIPNSPLSEG